jgi:hypothetical protein
MRAELRAIHAFEAALAARGLPPWTDADFAAFWAYEAAAVARAARRAREKHPNVGRGLSGPPPPVR